ncbi:hypothetical protein DRN69_06310 [Candidatus Pacearchaeota archaeon]|nr:MAG: hypothetical protein DRN69_06310 [Candidatus Pacearchaeota archaeon]
MDFYVIPPVKYQYLSHLGDRYFCLAQLYVKYKSYRKFFLDRKKEGRFITLDNGAAERSLVTEEVLLNVVKELQPNEVIAPDILFNKEKTILSLENFIFKMKKLGYLKYTKIFGCPQGSNKKEWISAYKYMLSKKEVSVIGLSKIAVPYCWLGATNDKKIAESRIKCVQYLEDNNLLKKPIHCLGMGNPTEFVFYKYIKQIRSTDSCYTILAAYNNINFLEGNFTRIKTPHNYFSYNQLSRKVLKNVIDNVAFMRQVCK